MPLTRRDSLALAVLLLCACPPEGCEHQPGSFESESGRWKFGADALISDLCEPVGTAEDSPAELLIAGTRWCPALACLDETIHCDIKTLDCHDVTIVGPAVYEDSCLEILDAGPITLQFDPIACDAAMGKPVLPETLALRAARTADIRGQLSPLLDRQAFEILSPETGASFDPDITPPRDATVLKVVDDSAVTMVINLWAGDDPVAWPRGQVEVIAEPLRGEPPTVALVDELELTLTVPAGSEADLFFVVADDRIPLGRVRAVDPDDLDDLDIVVAFYVEESDDGPEFRVPAGARAVLRDRDGDLVYGAPVTWSVEDGAFPIIAAKELSSDEPGRVGDYVVFHDPTAGEGYSGVCHAPPLIGTSEYEGRIVASYAGLDDEAVFTWKLSADSYDANLRELEVSPRCEGPGFAAGACGCTSDPRRSDIVVAITLLLLGARRRRRDDLPASISPRAST